MVQSLSSCNASRQLLKWTWWVSTKQSGIKDISVSSKIRSKNVASLVSYELVCSGHADWTLPSCLSLYNWRGWWQVPRHLYCCRVTQGGGTCFHQCTLRHFPLILKLFDKIGFLSSDCLGEDLRPEMQLLHQFIDISSAKMFSSLQCFKCLKDTANHFKSHATVAIAACRGSLNWLARLRGQGSCMLNCYNIKTTQLRAWKWDLYL